IEEAMNAAPETSFIASSIGRVMVAIISSAGMTPLSIRMTQRGKFVCGKTEEGIFSAANAPARHRTTVMNMMAVALWGANRPVPGWELIVEATFRVGPDSIGW